MDKRVNPNAGAMYELYSQGYSLADVGRAYGVTRQSIYGLFSGRGWKIRPKKKPLPFYMFNGNKYTKGNTGYYRKTDGIRSLMHRDVWEFYNGPIPDKFDIHHLDEDRTNNMITNLECLPKAEHTRRYSPHNNQYTRGRRRG